MKEGPKGGQGVGQEMGPSVWKYECPTVGVGVGMKVRQ